MCLLMPPTCSARCEERHIFRSKTAFFELQKPRTSAGLGRKACCGLEREPDVYAFQPANEGKVVTVMKNRWYERNWKRFFIRLTLFASLVTAVGSGLGVLSEVRHGESGLLFFLLGCVGGFLTVWLWYLIVWGLWKIGKWIYRGLDDD